MSHGGGRARGIQGERPPAQGPAAAAGSTAQGLGGATGGLAWERGARRPGRRGWGIRGVV